MRALGVALIVATLGTAPAAAQCPPSGWLHVALGASIIADGADLGTSAYAFGRGFREANPLFSWADDKPVAFAVAKMGGAVATNYLFLRLHRTHPKLAWTLTLANAAGKFWLAHRTARLIERAR